MRKVEFTKRKDMTEEDIKTREFYIERLKNDPNLTYPASFPSRKCAEKYVEALVLDNDDPRKYKAIPKHANLLPIDVNAIHEVIKEIFPEKIYVGTAKEKPNDGKIIFRDSFRNDYRFITVADALDKEKLSFFLKYFSKADLQMSFNTFTDGRALQSHIFSVNCIVLDVDYHKAGFDSWEQILYFLESDGIIGKEIPAPNYIEHGNNMRLIYVLEEPVYIPKNEAYRKFVKTMQDLLSKKLSSLGGDCQIINSYVRLPRSINTKHDNIPMVKWEPYSSVKWTLAEIADEFVAKPAWQKSLKQLKLEAKLNKKNGVKKPQHTINWQTHSKSILEDIVTLQKKYNELEDYGHREILCYLYRNYCILSGVSFLDSEAMVLKFNENFVCPLQEKEVLSKTNNLIRKSYRYKKKTLRDMFEEVLDDSLYFYSRGLDRKQYLRDYYEAHHGKNRKNKTLQIKQIILKAKLRGERNKDIVEDLKDKGFTLSLKSVERYVTALIKENAYKAA
jgi:hypothetical protein